MTTVLTFIRPRQSSRETCSPGGHGSPTWHKPLLHAQPCHSCLLVPGVSRQPGKEALQSQHPQHPEQLWCCAPRPGVTPRHGSCSPHGIGQGQLLSSLNAVSRKPENVAMSLGCVCLPIFHTADGSIGTQVQEHHLVDEGYHFSTKTSYSKETLVSVIHRVQKYIKTKMAKWHSVAFKYWE